MSSVKFQGITKRFADSELFSNLNLDIESGKLTVILGPSGCGKSTLLRLIAGLEYPDAGRILIDEQDVTREEARQRGVAMVFQNYALYPHLTVRENLAFPLKVAKVPKQDAAGKVANAADLLGLTELLERYPKTLSGGERQRTAVGRAIVRDPRLFLFDEPLSNLDFQLRNRMRGELLSLQRTLKKTVIYVTHDQTEGMTMADTLVLLNRGKVMQIGSPVLLYEKPANLFVAGFIGSPPMNILSIRSDGDNLYIADSDTPLARVKLPVGKYHVGVRPQQLEVTASESSAVMTVDHSEFHGSENYIFGVVEGQRVTARCRRDAGYRPGEAVKLTIPTSALHYFHKESGARIEPEGAEA